jgi:hypothetical protein
MANNTLCSLSFQAQSGGAQMLDRALEELEMVVAIPCVLFTHPDKITSPRLAALPQDVRPSGVRRSHP